MLINHQNLTALRTGFQTRFQQAFSGVTPHWPRVAMEVPSTTSKEIYAWLGAFPRMREWLGSRVIQNLAAHDFTIRNKTFELTVGVDRDDINDDNFGIYSPMMSEMGRAAASHPDELVFNLMKAGWTTVGYDGQPFFDADHPVIQTDGTVASVSNSGGGSGAAWFLLDTSRAVKPLILQMRERAQFTTKDRTTDDNVFNDRLYVYGVDGRWNVGVGLWQMAYGSMQSLDATAYSAARTAMMGFKADGGEPLGVMPNLLVVGPSNDAAAREILLAERNDAGATNTLRNTAELLVVPWLD